MADPTSVLSKRKRLASRAGQHFGGDRDLYSVMGYPDRVGTNDFISVYNRQDIAARIVDAFPDATWREPPVVNADKAFVRDWNEIESRHKLWRTFHRLDRLAGLGHYGVLLLGLDGGEDMREPVNTGRNYNLLYLQPHSERTAEVLEWENDPSNPRYGRPRRYQVTTGINWTGMGSGQRTIQVHHSRVIHVAERALEDVSIGTPRLERIFNRLMDLDKLLGGGAEIYWQNSAMLLAFIADKDVEWEEDEQAAMASQLEEMQHGLRRMLRLRGVEASQLAPGIQGQGPSGLIDSQLDMIAGAAGVPKRILIGSERGELSSEQDENNWAARISERREQYAGPSIVEEFARKGQALGFLSQSNVKFEWRKSDTLGEQARAEVADKKAGAIQKYMGTPGSELLVTPEEFRETLGYDSALPQEELEEEPDEQEPDVVAQFSRHKEAWS